MVVGIRGRLSACREPYSMVGKSARSGTRWLVTLLVTAALLGTSCRSEEPGSDLEYLVWEVCRQVRLEGVTPDQVDGILHDASRHGAVMELIEAECGDDIARIYTDP